MKVAGSSLVLTIFSYSRIIKEELERGGGVQILFFVTSYDNYLSLKKKCLLREGRAYN